MVTESSYWKVPLLEMAGRIEASKGEECLSDDDFAQFERDLFLGFFSIRKLMDSVPKVTRRVYDAKIQLRQYSRNENSKPFDDWNKPDWHQFFDMANYALIERGLRFVANQFIHSHLFIPSGEGEDDQGRVDPDGIFFASDNQVDRNLFFIATDDVISAFRLVGNDYPQSVRMSRDPATGLRAWQIPEN